MKEHLERCGDCRGEWRGLRQTVRLVAHLGAETCPVDLRAGVLQAVARREAAPWWGFATGRALALRAAAGLALVGVGLLLWRLESLPEERLPSGLQAPAVVAAESHLHEQYDLVNGLGTTDGLLLSVPADGGRSRYGPDPGAR